MTVKASYGKQPGGNIGLYIAKAGFDVYSANAMQMAFSSDFVCPNLVASGSLVSTPTNGGITVTTTAVYYGRSISPAPFVAAIATASSWPCPTADHASQLGYLAGNWHTFIWEYPPDMTGETARKDTTYGPTAIRPARYADGGSDIIDITFASARFTMGVFTDRVEFYTNCYNNVTIKYVILEP